MRKKRVWHSGPPPHVGWWNMSCLKNEDVWRWWDGYVWSSACTPDMSAEKAAMAAAKNGDATFEVFWSDYYPKNARVPRVAPTPATSTIDAKTIAREGWREAVRAWNIIVEMQRVYVSKKSKDYEFTHKRTMQEAERIQRIASAVEQT